MRESFQLALIISIFVIVCGLGLYVERDHAEILEACTAQTTEVME